MDNRRVGYSIVEQYSSLVFLEDFYEEGELDEYIVDLHKKIEELERLPSCVQQKIMSVSPVNLPQLYGNFSKKLDCLEKEEYNIELNELLFQNKFDYNIWRETNGLRSIKEMDLSKYMYTNFDSDNYFEKLTIENILLLLKKLDIGLFKYVKDIVERKIVYVDTDTFRCVHLPLSNTSVLVFPTLKKEAFRNVYILHEISHAILNYYQICYDVILSIEDEEGLAHFIESSICNIIIKEELSEYRKLLSNLLIENRSKLDFQIELFKNYSKYRTKTSKEILYSSIFSSYGVMVTDSFTSLFQELPPFYAASYIIGQERAIENIGKIDFFDLTKILAKKLMSWDFDSLFFE